MADSTVKVPQDAVTIPGVFADIDTDGDGTVERQKVWDAGPLGTWGYTAGTSGTPDLTGKRVLSVIAHAAVAGSITIDSGDTITIPANTQFALPIRGALEAPTIVFTGTDSYVVEHVE